ncbi:TOM1-like protein 2 isoform X1 [Microplitis demolitor]|uniref:TOM1-like protein 2 isoform X1 n=1 Tax=Microplitis demolitor TaxID=69319 RepID=UPI0004CD27BF|nr:TOM1-like protein 2 isoform X1 [Microplitis demolitor]
MSFFGVNVNPFSTPVGQKIEQATDGSLPSENWALNMEICDIINETEDGPRDAIKAIKKRLGQAAGKNYTVVLYTLTVLETCVKNCGKRFHTLACSREFILELVKMIGPKNEPPTAVQEKVLSLIQTWADTFRYQPHTQGVVQVYQELKAKGMQFPMTDLDAMAPIITPERSVPEVTSSPSLVQGNERISVGGCDVTSAAQHQPVSQVQASLQPVQLSDQLVSKLRSELEVVQGNMRVLAEMLHFFTNPDQQQQKNSQQTVETRPDPADLELMHQLYSTCKAMQERVVDLIGRLVDDEMTAELLRINDELNNLFLRYSRYTKNKTVPAASAILAQTLGHPADNQLAHSASAKRPEQSLIDLDEDSIQALEGAVADIGISATDGRSKGVPSKNKREDLLESDEFDMFAQSRNATYESTKNTGSKYEDNLEDLSGNGSLSSAILSRGSSLTQPTAIGPATGKIPSNRESDFNEMAAWLDESTAPKEQGDQESLTSSEFERFLAERAAAAEALPNLPTVTAAPSTATSGTTNIPRQINKDQDKSLFAL